MKLKNILLMAAFGLTSALAVHTAHSQAVTTQAAKVATIKIAFLPFNITAPGTYVLTGNLISPVASTSNTGAINIFVPLSGAVILDLKGFSLKGTGGFATGIDVAYNFPSSGNTYSITIRNGTLTNFGYGIITANNGQVHLSDITVDNIVFNTSEPTDGNGGRGVRFVEVNSSTVNNCTFNGSYIGIEDIENLGGNSYSNDSFLNFGIALSVGGTPLTLNHCQFAAPLSN